MISLLFNGLKRLVSIACIIFMLFSCSNESSSPALPSDLDITPPVITLLGDNPLILNLGDIYVEAGALAIDDIDGPVDVRVSGEVNSAKAGDYGISYSAVDAAGNQSSAVRNVHVVNTVDAIAPIITLIGDNPLLLRVGDTYEEPGATAVDNVDGVVIVSISGSVNTALIGEYQISYSAIDSSNNQSQITRLVKVRSATDLTAPVITLHGYNPTTLVQGSRYYERGATAVDDYDGQVPTTVTGVVNTNLAGSYSVTYTAKDSAGNETSVIRLVNVVVSDSVAPVITLKGENPNTINYGESYPEPGANVVDDVDGVLFYTISYDPTFITVSLGSHYTDYTATDAAGNSSTVRRISYIVDLVPPDITLNGFNPMSILKGSIFSDPGAIAVDNRDKAITYSVSGNVDSNTAGSYTISYSATDAQSNTNSIDRIVNVIDFDSIAPNITLIGDNIINLDQGDTYWEYGANAVDNIDGDVAFNISGIVDTTTPGQYVITYSAIDSSSNASNTTRIVNVAAFTATPFITTWKTDNVGVSQDSQIQIMTDSEGYRYHYSVDWGDGQKDNGLNGNALHTYAVSGTYTVKIIGDFPHLIFDPAIPNDAKKLLSVEQWGTNKWRSMRQAFNSCENLVVNATDAPDLSRVTDMSSMFVNATSMNQDISFWNVSSVTDMSYLFYKAAMFNQRVDKWNVSSVKKMDYMFAAAANFNQPLSAWDMHSVTSTPFMFAYTAAFSQDLGSWDVSNVENMDFMFYGSNFNGNIANWNVSKVKRMEGMLAFTLYFNQNINNWDVSSVYNMAGMFEKAMVFNMPLDRWDVSSVRDMNTMFKGAASFDQNLGSWNVSHVSNFGDMFLENRLSTENYDALLQGWSKLELLKTRTFHAGLSQYSSASQLARDIMTDLYSWTIIDNGVVP